MSILPSLPTLEGNGLRLRPMTPDDHSTLFNWHADLRNLHLWWSDRQVLSFEEFVEDLRRRLSRLIQVLFMVEAEASDGPSPVGMVYTYGTNLIDRYTYLCIYLAPESTGRGLGPEAGFLMVNYLFAFYGFRKVYAEVFAYNGPSLKAAARNGFVEEGRLREHRWFLDRYWDLYVLALTYDSFLGLAHRGMWRVDQAGGEDAREPE